MVKLVPNGEACAAWRSLCRMVQFVPHGEYPADGGPVRFLYLWGPILKNVVYSYKKRLDRNLNIVFCAVYLIFLIFCDFSLNVSSAKRLYKGIKLGAHRKK